MKFWYSTNACTCVVTKADKVMPLDWYEISQEMFEDWYGKKIRN